LTETLVCASVNSAPRRPAASLSLASGLSSSFDEHSPQYRDKLYGFPALGRVVRELDVVPQPDERFELECNTSSVGEANGEWLRTFYNSLPSMATTARLPPITVQFPSQSQVESSLEGIDVGLYCLRRRG
jgi:hypothetical protein